MGCSGSYGALTASFGRGSLGVDTQTSERAMWKCFLMRRTTLIFVFATAFAVSSCAFIRARENDKLSLAWYGLVRNASSTNPIERPLTDGAAVLPGEGIQLFVSVKPAAFLYVIHQSPTGLLTVWWPSESSGFNAYAEGERVLTLPARGKVHVLDPAQGIEAVYLIAAFKPVNRVDNLTKEIRWLLGAAQALGSGVPENRVNDIRPRGMVWKIGGTTPIQLAGERIPLASNVRSIGTMSGPSARAENDSGRVDSVVPERIRGGEVVARVVRIHRRIR